MTTAGSAEANRDWPIGLDGYCGIALYAGWQLHIGPDGSGYYIWGAGPEPAGSFGPGTFDFNALVKRLHTGKVSGAEAVATGCTITLVKPGIRIPGQVTIGESESEKVIDPQFIVSLFYKAYAASSPPPDALTAKEWSEHPPAIHRDD